MIRILGDELLDVDLGLSGLAREGDVHAELAVELLGVLDPLLLEEVIPPAAPAAVEEVDRAPVLERVRSVLVLGLARERDTLLDEGAEGGDSLYTSAVSSRAEPEREERLRYRVRP